MCTIRMNEATFDAYALPVLERMRPAITAAADGCDYAVRACRWIDRQFTCWTNSNLAPNLANIAQRAFHSLPVIVATLVLPLPLQVATGMGLVLLNHIHPEALTPGVRVELYDGFGFGKSVQALFSTAAFAATCNPLYLLTGLIQAAVATYCFDRVRELRPTSAPSPYAPAGFATLGAAGGVAGSGGSVASSGRA